MSKGVVFGLVLAAMAGLNVSALQVQVGYSGSPYGPYQAGEGGEFTLVPINPAFSLDTSDYAASSKNFGVAGSFQTFCLEYAEYIYPFNSTYTITINTAAMSGGIGGGANGDPISKATGYLYSEFAKGTLTGYNYSGTEAQRETSAAALQKAIWMLEQEKTVDLNNYFLKQIIGTGKLFANIDLARADGGSSYGVYALNMWDNSRNKQGQDQLYYQAVPDAGATAILLAFGTASVFLFRRRQ